MSRPDVPRAIATGFAGSTASDDRVRPHRAATGVGVLAAVFLFAVYGVRNVPGPAIELLGGPGAGVARFGGITAIWHPPAGTDLAHVQFGDGATLASARREGDHAVIELPGVSEANARDVIERLGVGGGLEFREVIESKAANGLADLGLASKVEAHEPIDRGREPTVEVDEWRPEGNTDELHFDFYLFAHSRATLDAAVAEAQRRGWTPPPGTKIVYEKYDPSPDARDQRVAWRSYFVKTAGTVDGTDIANARASYDPNTNRPVVLLDFTREGGRKFGELTARIAGHKLATILGGDVKSAPIINEAIRGGKVEITMGGNNPTSAEHERDVLVEVLKAGAVVPGGTITDTHWSAPPSGSRGFVARVLVALAGGAAAFGLTWLLVGATRPERRSVPPFDATSDAPRLGRKLAWTLLGVGIYLAGTYVKIPGIHSAELAHIIPSHDDDTALSVFSLGLSPLISSFVIVEILASLVPRWRRLRDTVHGRRRLGLATAIAAIAVACVQAYFVAVYTSELSRGGADIFDPRMFWLAAASIAAGPLCLAIVASLIGSRGIGSGYAVLIVVAWLWQTTWFYVTEAHAATLVLASVAIVATAVIGLALLRWCVRAPGRVAIPLPAAGDVPLQGAGGVLAFVGALAALGVTLPRAFDDAFRTLRGSLLIGAIVLAIATAAWSYAFARPGRRRATLAAAGIEPAGGELWLRAAVLSAAALAALFAIGMLGTRARTLARLADPAMVIFAAATLADLAAEWRVRRRAALVAVWPLHDPLLVDVARDRLAAAGIPHHIQSTRLRSLLWLCGAFVPMMVLAPAEHAEAAHVLLRDWLAPSPSVDA